MCKREKSRPHQKNACSGEKTWGEPRDSLVESPIYWSKRLAHGVRFQLGESFFRGEDFASHPGAEVRPAGCTQQRPVDIALVPWGPASRMCEILSPENSFTGVKQTWWVGGFRGVFWSPNETMDHLAPSFLAQ